MQEMMLWVRMKTVDFLFGVRNVSADKLVKFTDGVSAKANRN